MALGDGGKRGGSGGARTNNEAASRQSVTAWKRAGKQVDGCGVKFAWSVSGGETERVFLVPSSRREEG